MLRVWAFCILHFALCTFHSSAGAQLKWQTSYAAASKTAAASHKPLCVDFMASWCGPCRKMDEETFHDPRVQALMQKMVLVRLDVDNRPPQAKTYGVNSIPRLIVLPAGGGQPVMDVLGYCDAEELSQQLRTALGLSPQAAPQPRKLADDVMKVSEALGTHRYAALKAQDPKTAAAGLDKLAEQLGATKEEEFKAALQIIRNAGDDAVPAFLHGLAHPHLAVRVGCYRALQETFRGSSLPSFDAWAPAGSRKAQAARWRQWWESQRSRRASARTT